VTRWQRLFLPEAETAELASPIRRRAVNKSPDDVSRHCAVAPEGASPVLVWAGKGVDNMPRLIHVVSCSTSSDSSGAEAGGTGLSARRPAAQRLCIALARAIRSVLLRSVDPEPSEQMPDQA
jgi:hypothetical protein